MDIVSSEAEQYALSRSSEEPELLRRLAEETATKVPFPQMLSGHLEGRLLKLLAQSLQAKRVLEIGTYTGYSALCLAEALPQDGELITCDIDEAATAVARRYWAESPHGDKIRLRLGPALETLESLEPPFDLVFLDADKENYPKYYEAVLPLLRPGGLLLIDNVLWSMKVLDPKEPSDRAIDALNRRITGDERVEAVLLTVRDGIQLVRKK